MNRKTHTTRRIVSALALIGSVAAIAVPTAAGGNQNDPGLVSSKLGSQDPRDTAGKALFWPGIVASRLGSQDPRDTAVDELNQPSLVAMKLGSPDSRDTVAESLSFDSAAQEHRAALVRSMASNNLLHHTITPTPVDSTQVSNDGIDWGKVGIGIAVAVCGLLLFGALGIGARQVRQGGHRLGRA